MPELAEVEVLAREMNDTLSRCTIEKVFQSVWYRDNRADKRPEANVKPLEGWTISGVTRHGKALLFMMENPGVGNRYLSSRLGMSGVWSIKPEDYDWSRDKHLWLVLTMSHPQGRVLLTYSDARRFGSLEVGDQISSLRSLSVFGPDIRSPQFSPEWIEFVCSGKSVPIKALLLEQAYFAGVGNWLASEVLAVAHINPLMLSKKLDKKAIARLYQAIQIVVSDAIHRGGASLMSWQNAAGEEGDAQNHMLVYGRAGQPCLECGEEIKKVTVRGRGTYFCKRCQAEDWQEPEPVSEAFVEQVAKEIGIGQDGRRESGVSIDNNEAANLSP